MRLFLSLLPVYLFGNLHCAGMCGPLVMLLAKHPHRWWYFLGRTFSFTCVGLLSAEMGLILFSFLARYHISASVSLLFGLWIVLTGVYLILKLPLPGSRWLSRKTGKLSTALAKLSLQGSPGAIFLFGACTILLPCGQTLIVFSVIALNGSPLEGLLNGFAFALLTSPALIAAMHTLPFLRSQSARYHLYMGGACLIIGALALLRGCADLGLTSHLALNPSSPPSHHIVLY